MLVLVLIAQFIVIIWLLVLLCMTTGGLKNQISRASRHLEMTDKPSELEDPKPICGCQHHQCFHDESGCAATTIPTTRWVSTGTSVIAQPDAIAGSQPCGCKRYTGPEALPTVLP